MPKKTETTGEAPAETNEVVQKLKDADIARTDGIAEEVLVEAPQYNCVPPHRLVRNEFGLLTTVNYIFDEDGYVDWRKMIDPKFLAAQKDAPNKAIEELKDNQLIILLGGIKKLARIRGYKEVSHRVIVATPDYVAVATTITWRGNYETGDEDIQFTSLADAHGFNTEGLMKHYLTAIAENRGFVRAVRNFLNVNIAGKEELGAKAEDSSGEIKPNGKTLDILLKLLEVNKVDFGKFQNRMILENVEDAADWTSFEDIPSNRLVEIIGTVEEVLSRTKK